MKRFLCVCALVFLAACEGGSGDGSGGYTKTSTLSYEYEINGCNTGKHTFSSVADMCDGLKSQSLNDYCAVSFREAKFENMGCSGDFELES